MTQTLSSHSFSSRSLAYSLLAGPVLWFVHFIAVYIVAEFGCRANFTNLTFVTPATIRLLIAVFTVGILVAVGVGELLAYRQWQNFQAQGERQGERLGDRDSAYEARYYFLTVIAMALGALFLVSILVTAMPTFFVNVCDLAA